MVGARLRSLRTAERPIVNRMPVRVHTGTAEGVGEVVLLDAEEIGPGEEGLVQFRLEQPLVCAPGDRFVLRLASPLVTLGGGTILEESRYRLKRFKRFVIDELERQAASLGSTSALLEALLARAPGRWETLDELSRGLKRPRADTDDLLRALEADGRAVALGPAGRWIHAETLELCLARRRDAREAWFREHPMRSKMDVRDLRASVDLDPALLGVLLEREAEEERVRLEAGGRVALPGREVELDDATRDLRDRLVALFDAARFQPPSPDELATELGAPRPAVDAVVQLCVDERSVEHVGGELFVSAAVLDEARAAVIANCEKNESLEIPELRDALQTTRKFLIPILEHFDTEGLTLRQAGRRVLKRR